jgi:hypothetical protein
MPKSVGKCEIQKQADGKGLLMETLPRAASGKVFEAARVSSLLEDDHIDSASSKQRAIHRLIASLPLCCTRSFGSNLGPVSQP